MRRHPQMVRLILSGYAEQESIAKGLGAIHQVLMKPCDLQTLKSTLTRVCGLDAFLRNEKARALVASMSVLPSVPSVYFRVVKELQSSDASIDKIGEIIATDPGMTAKMLQLVNSAFFGVSRSISSPAEAVQLLGVNIVRSLALSIHAFTAFEQHKSAVFALQQFWNHSLLTGLIAQKIVHAAGQPSKIAEDAFIAGLLHDLGKLMLSVNRPREYREAVTLARKRQITIGDAEGETFGATHADVGAYLLGLWGLPAPIVEGVAFHHTPRNSPTRGFSPLTAVHVANVLQHKTQPDPGGSVPSTLDEQYLAELGLTEQVDPWRIAVAEIGAQAVS